MLTSDQPEMGLVLTCSRPLGNKPSLTLRVDITLLVVKHHAEFVALEALNAGTSLCLVFDIHVEDDGLCGGSGKTILAAERADLNLADETLKYYSG